ncbi:MAG: glycosyltransferase, partial [Nocardiopsaceae bacterium]|nr:glycosyltransferase [Nocardiopsaceae bacterium]
MPGGERVLPVMRLTGPNPWLRRVLDRHGIRFTSFSVIGAVVLVAGIGVQALLLRAHAGPYGSYAGQAVFSIELSYALNRWITWRDRRVGFWPSAWRFNVQKLVLTVPNLALYAAGIQLGTGWLVANLGTTAVFTVANYLTGDLWSFAAGGATRLRARVPRAHAVPVVTTPLPRLSALGALPTVSVVIPCKSSERTIRATVDALLAQDYPELVEVICVGDVGDSTWSALAGITDPRLVILEHAKTPGRRDPNVKRDRGVRQASGEVLAFADSDIVMAPGWLSAAVRLLCSQGSGLVAGGMRSIHDTFWGRFVDRNALAAKTPRIPQPYQVTAVNFGKRGFKPPVTANAVFTRDLYESCPLDVTWSYGYEDYEWFWRVAKNGHEILFSRELTAAHHHRRSFRRLALEYRQSSHGCAHFVRAHPDSPLARKRLLQAILLPIAGLAAVVTAGLAVAAGRGMDVAITVGAAVVLLAGREVVAARSPEAVTYPTATLALGLIFTLNLGRSLFRAPREAPAPRESSTKGDRLARARWCAVGFAVLLAGGAALRLWSLASRPGWQFDENVYADVAVNLLRHGTLNENITYRAPWTPELYQPPYYFLLLSRWFAVTGASIYHARILGVAFALAALVLLWRLLVRLLGPGTALLAMVPVMFDGWLLYAQRVSYLENVLLFGVVAGLLLYQRAVDKPSAWRFALAGVVLGCAVGFKYTGVYALLAVPLCWQVRGGHRGGHLLLLGCAAATLGCSILLQVRWFDLDGHNWWLSENMVQVNRVLGVRVSGGTLTSPFAALHLLSAEYYVFVPSLLIAAAAVCIGLRRLLACYRARSFAPLRDTGNALLWSWAATAVVIFGESTLKYPQYISLVLVPLYAYFWSEARHWRWRWLPRWRRQRRALAEARRRR